MDPIRPNSVPTPPASGADVARQAAQRAFFDAAMGRAGAPAAAAPQAARLSTVATAAAPPPGAGLRPDPAAEPPARLLRPGSLLDIRV